jgi:integrase
MLTPRGATHGSAGSPRRLALSGWAGIAGSSTPFLSAASRAGAGGLELPIKVVQERLGHSSIIMTRTSDRYGHLFPRSDDGAELAAAGRDMMGLATR